MEEYGAGSIRCEVFANAEVVSLDTQVIPITAAISCSPGRHFVEIRKITNGATVELAG